MNESKEIVVQVDKNHALSKWDQPDYLAKVKEVFGADLSPIEFEIFLEMGKSTGLNPFLREIWAVKYDKTKPAQIFIGRDGYRKAAQQDPDYEYHYAEAVYSNDHFTAKDGIYEHSFNIKDRGVLRGAFCVVKKKSVVRPFCLYVPFEEYNKQQQTWRTMPSTMIKKVVEVQGLRTVFQGIFAGTYSDAEDWIDVSAAPKQDPKPPQEPKKQIEEPKPVNNAAQQQKIQGVAQSFDLANEFEQKRKEITHELNKLFFSEVGKMDVDDQFRTSFFAELMVALKKEYIDRKGNIELEEFFEKELLWKRICILTLNHNLVREPALQEIEIKDLKNLVYKEMRTYPDKNLQEVFTRQAISYISI